MPERVRHQQQFEALQPINGIITGVQAKDFLLKSQLPPPVLGQIWYLYSMISIQIIKLIFI